MNTWLYCRLVFRCHFDTRHKKVWYSNEPRFCVSVNRVPTSLVALFAVEQSFHLYEIKCLIWPRVHFIKHQRRFLCLKCNFLASNIWHLKCQIWSLSTNFDIINATFRRFKCQNYFKKLETLSLKRQCLEFTKFTPGLALVCVDCWK